MIGSIIDVIGAIVISGITYFVVLSGTENPDLALVTCIICGTVALFNAPSETPD